MMRRLATGSWVSWWVSICLGAAVSCSGEGADAGPDAVSAVDVTDVATDSVDAGSGEDSVEPPDLPSAPDVVPTPDPGAEEPDMGEGCHVDCFGGASCSDGIVTEYVQAPLPCADPLPDCVERTYGCEHGCRARSVESSDVGGSSSAFESYEDALCAPKELYGPACDSGVSILPYDLNLAVLPLLQAFPSGYQDCGCMPYDSDGLLGDAAQVGECFCLAWAACEPARVRRVNPSGEASDLVVVPNGVGGCDVYELQDDSGGDALHVVEAQRCRGLACEIDAVPITDTCGPAPTCANEPTCGDPNVRADVDGDGCFDRCCLGSCPADFVLTVNDEGCGTGCADAPCTKAADCSVYPCSLALGSCDDPVGICTAAGCDGSGPVCGCDGVTYESGCAASQAGTGAATTGACPGGP